MRVVIVPQSPIIAMMRDDGTRRWSHVPPHQWLETIADYAYDADNGVHRYTFASTVKKVDTDVLGPHDGELPLGLILRAKHHDRRTASWFFDSNGELQGFEYGTSKRDKRPYPPEVALALREPGDES